MTAIVSGNSLGLLNSSLYVLGAQGALGQSPQGRSGEQVFVNGSSGNLVIQNRDELLIGRGPDLSLLRTYNSQGLLDGDNNDSWRFGVYRKVYNLTGTVNTAGSTVTRVAEDGSESLYTFDATLGKYVCHDGGGSFDTLSFTSATQTWTWSWTDGTNQRTELYDNANGGRITKAQDQDGNGLTLTYNAAGLITQVSDANGESTFLDYTGTNLTQLRTVNSAAQTLVRTRYAYDASNRLTQVTTDLSPEDASIADGKTYVVNYTYDGTSKRVATLTQTDGNNLSFTYIQVGSDWKVASYTDASGTTNLAYTQGTGSAPATASANGAVLSTTVTTSTNFNLISGALTAPTAAWGTASLRESLTGSSATSPQVSFDQNGNGMAVWALGADLYYSTYTKNTNTWSAGAKLEGTLTGNPTKPDLAMSANGNAIVTWVQNNNIYARRYIAGVWDGASTIPNLENLTTAALNPMGAINNNGRAVVAFLQPTSGTTNSLYVNVYNGTAWQAAATALDDIGTANSNSIGSSTIPSVAIDANNNATVLWLQRTGTQTADSLYFSRLTASTGTWSAPISTTLENTTTAVTAESIAFDGSGNGIAIWLQGGSLLAKSYTAATNTWSTAATTLSTATATVPNLSMSANGNGLVTWIQGGNVVARRYAGGAWIGTGPTTIENLTTPPLNPVGSINNAGQAVVVFVQPTSGTTNSLYANRFSGTAWQTAATLIESSGNSIAAGMVPSVAIDALGDVNAVWLQRNGTETTDSVFSNRFTSATSGSFYLVKSTDTWNSIATALYGSTSVTSALQAAMGNPTLTTGLRLSGFPASLTGTTTTTVAPYYTVLAGDTWESIAQVVYGDAQAASALQAALGNPALTAGVRLTVPQTLSYTKLITAAVRADITDALGLVTSLFYDATGQIVRSQTPGLGGAAGLRLETQFAYDANGNVASVTDPRGNVISYGYDANGNRILERDAAGNTITRVFDSKSELLAETSYVVPDPDGAGAGQPGTPLTTRYVYDANGHLRFVVSAEGRVTEYRYNAFGQRVAGIQYTGALYNLTGLTPTSTLTEANLTAWLPADKSASLRIDSSYDFRGQVSSTTSYATVDALGNGVADGTQSVTQYVYDQTGNLLKTVDPRGVTTPADPNDFTTTYVYDGLGRRLSSTDALGHTTLTQYDDANRKTVITSANGLVTTSSYDAKGELVSVVQSSGAQVFGTTTYFYDADGRPRRTVDPTGISNHVLYDEAGRTVATIDGDGSLTEYIYDADSNVTKTIRYATLVSAASLATLVDAQGKPTGVALAAIRPAGGASDRITFAAYDAANRQVKAVDEAGFVTQNFYDGVGRLTDTVRFATAISTATLTDTPAPASINPTSSGADRLSRNFYDAQGKLRGSLDGEGFLVEYKYDAAGQLVETVGYANATDPTLRATGTLAQLIPAGAASDIHGYLLYNAKGQAAATVDGEGFLTENVYDLAGNKTQVIRYATKVIYTAGATLASLRPAANAQDQTTSTAYTAINQVASTTAPDGTLSNYFYDETGNVVKTVKAAGTTAARSLLTQYDKLGRVTAEISGNGGVLITGDQTQAEIDAIWAAHATKYTYDAASRRTSSTDADGHKTLYFYNADGRLTHAINALGEVIESTYNAFGQVSRTTQYGTRLPAATLATLSGGLVNAALTAAIAGIANAALDSTTTTTFYTTGRVAQANDALGNAVTQAFNAFGDLTASSQAIGGGLTLDHAYSYDRRGLLTLTVWDPSGINTSASTVYDAFGRAIQSTDARGNVSTNTYDRLGRTIASTDRLNQTTSLTYDAFGRVLTQTDPLGKTTTFAYNTVTRTLTVTSSEGVTTTTVKNRHGETLSVTDGRGNTTSYQYDKDGNLIRTDAPGAGTTTQLYDNADLLIEAVDANGVKTNYTYDAANRLLTKTLDTGAGRLNLVTSYAYDAKGQMVSTTDAKGVVTQTTFDLKGEVVSVVVDPGAGHLNLTTTFTYDARGKKVTMTEGAGSASPRVTQYTYDKLGRLTQQRVDPSGINSTTTYAYNKNNSVTKKVDANGNVTRYAYDADDRLVYTVNALGGVSRNDYDADGRITRLTGYANAISLAGLSDFPSLSDIASRITASAGDETKSYVYDGSGREVYCIDALGGVTQKFYDGNGNVVRSVLYANPVPVTTALTQAAVTAALTPNAAKDAVARTVYDAANRAVYAIDAGNYVKETQYDPTGRITRTIQYTQPVAVGATPTAAEMAAAVVADANKQANAFTYDAGGRLSSSTDAEGFTETYAYDAVGNAISFTNKKGAVWNYVYDAAGRLTSELTPSVEVTSVVDNAGTISASSASARIETRVAYDALGNVLSRTEAFGRPEARTTQYLYDALGRQVRTTFPTVNVYNAAGDNLTTNGISGSVTRVETAVAPQVNVSFDALGNAVVNRDTAGSFSYKVYDGLGRVKYEIDAERFVTAFGYDSFGNQTSVTRYATALNFGAITGFAAHVDGAAFTLAEVAARLAIGTNDRTITTQYDALNRASAVIQPAVFTFDSTAPAGSPQTFTAGATIRNTYNALGQLIKQSTLKNPGADLQVGSADDTWVDTYFFYDARGNKTAQVDALGFLTIWQYDETSDITRQVQYAKALAAGTWSTSGFGTPVTTTPQANPASPIGYDREITYQYDRKNQKIAETLVNAEFGTVTGTLTLGTTAANLTTTYGYDGVGNLTSVTDPTGATTYSYYDVLGRVIATAEPARFSDGGNGTVVMPTLNVSYTLATNTNTIAFAKTAPTDTTVGLLYRVAGTTTWTAAPLQVQGTATFIANISVPTSDRYEYQVTYTRAGDPAPYATGSGQINLIGASSATSANVVAVVGSPSITGASISASAHYDAVPGTEGGFSLVFDGTNLVDLSWNSLAVLGSGNIHVRLNYQTYQFSGGTLLGAGGSASIDQTFAATAADTGTTLRWSDVEGAGVFNAGVLSITSVQVWKVVNGVEVPLINAAPGTQPDKMFVLGKTAGLTGINVAGVGTLAATSLGGGVFSVSLAGLSRGSYTFTPVGTTSAVGGAFDVTHSSTAGRAGVQEVATITQAPATTVINGSSLTSAFESLLASGSTTTTVNRTLNAYNLPTSAASAVLQYRPSGSTGPFLSKTLNAAGPGEFSIAYDDVANGSYEFILTVRNSAGTLLDLTAAGGTAAGTISGTIKVRRGGELPSVTASANALTLVPLTITRYDVFGNTVQTTKFAKGAVNADANVFGLPSADANDQTTFNFFDTLGHLVRSVDPEGASKFSSYDVLGQVAKTWMPITNNDAQVNNAIQVFQYDKLGHQTATIEPSYLPFQPGVPLNPANFATSQAQYNAFGEVTSKGLNGGAQEYFQFDNAGHLWRTNEKDGVNKVFLFDLQGKTTSQILSQTLDLLNGFSSASQVAALTSGVERTDTRYDKLERVTQQVTPTFAVQQALEAYPTALGMVNASLSVNSYSAAHYDAAGELGFVWNSSNSISLGWNDLSFLGGGNVLVTVDYINANGTAGAFSQEFASGAAATGVSMSWDVDERTGGGFGAGFESRVRVWKRDVSGNLVAIFDQAGTGSVSNLVTSIVPPEVGTGVSANFKIATSPTFAPIAIFNMGNRYLVNTLSLGVNTYDLDVLYTRPGTATPYAHASGRFAKSGGGITNTTTAANVSLLSMTPTMTQTLDRWGNALTVTDARGFTINYRYNYLDSMVQEDLPLTDVWGANGVNTVTRPVIRNFYDKAGRGLGTIDANGNATTARYDGAGQLIAEFHADGGVLNYQYDAFGRRTRTIDALGKITDSIYDRDNRLTSVKRPIGQENYAYDQAGNRIRVTNAAGEVTRYWYDTRGKLIRSQTPGGQQTNSFYDLRGNKIREVTANGDQPVWSYDYFGRMLAHTDMGGGVYGFTYDKAGRLAQQTLTRGASSGVTTYQFYENGMLKRVTDSGVGGETFYEYDAAGNRTRERYVKGGVVFQDDRMTYDQLGRLATLKDNRIQLTTYKYDANGNRRNVHSDYFDSNNVLQHLDSWYLYDGMNRITLSQGVLAGGVIQINTSQGVQLQYDAASNRRVATSFQSGALVAESYNYDDNGRLTTTNRGGQLTSSRAYDLAGRVTQQISYSSPGVIKERRQNAYNINGQLTQQQIFDGAGTLTQTTNYTGYDGMGNVTSYNINVPVATAFTNFYSYTYAKFEGYKESVIAGSSTFFQPGNTTTTYDINGNVLTVSDQFATSKFRSFVTDGSGDILQKTENGQTQYYFFANDKPIGSTGALGAADFDYNYTPVSDLYPATAPSRYVVSKGDTLRSIALVLFGDAQLWYVIADANGMRSDADLKVGQQLVIPNKISNLHNDSQTFKVVLPSEIIGDTTPTLPDPPPPPQPRHGGGCGGFGAILVAIVSIVVAIVLPIAAPAIFGAQAGILGAIGTAVVSNLAGQVTANIVGLQHGINFGSIAASALSAGISFGVLGGTGAPGTVGAPTEFGQAIGQVGRAVVGNVISQGVNIVLGQQRGFSWAAVAGAAVSAGVTQAVTEGLNGVPGQPGYTAPSPFNSAVASFAGGLAGGVVRAVLSGGRINFAQIAADAFGNALGTFIGQSIAQNIGQQQQALQQAQARAAQPEEVEVAAPRPQPVLGVAPLPEVVVTANPNVEVAAETATPADPTAGMTDFEREVAEAQDRDEAERGAELRALMQRQALEAGTGAALRGLQYGAEGLEPRVTNAADVAGHTFLPLIIAQSLGISNERLGRIIEYSQFPDQISALDATTNGVRSYWYYFSNYDPATFGVLSESALHSLNGQPMVNSIAFYQTLIAENRGNDAILGMALHGLVDAVFHARDVNGVMTDYDAPAGHVWQGHDQDYIKYTSRTQVLAATGQLMTAFETIAGTTLTDEQRAAVYTNVNAALDRARARTTQDLYDIYRWAMPGTFTYVNPDQRMELNFRDVVREMLAAPPGVRIEDLPNPLFRGPITEEGTLAEGRTFFSYLPQAQADTLTRQGMEAAAYIMNRYLETFNNRTVPGPVLPNSLFDTPVAPPRPRPAPRLR